MATLSPPTARLHIGTTQALHADFTPAKYYVRSGGGSLGSISGPDAIFTAPGSNSSSSVCAENEFWWLALIGGYTSNADNSATVTGGQRAVSLSGIIDPGSKVVYIVPTGWAAGSGGFFGLRGFSSGLPYRVHNDGTASYNEGSTEHTFSISDGDVLEFERLASDFIKVTQIRSGSPIDNFTFATAHTSEGLSADLTFNASGTFPRPEFVGNWVQSGGNAWLAAKTTIETTTGLVVSPTSVANAVETVVYSQSPAFSAVGGTGSYTYSQTSGSPPDGMTFNTSTKKFEGTPDVGQAGDFPYTIHATDGTLTGDVSGILTVEALPMLHKIDVGKRSGSPESGYELDTVFATGSDFTSAGVPTSKDVIAASVSDAILGTCVAKTYASGSTTGLVTGLHANRDVYIKFVTNFGSGVSSSFQFNINGEQITRVHYTNANSKGKARGREAWATSNDDGELNIEAISVFTGGEVVVINEFEYWEKAKPVSAAKGAGGINFVVAGDSISDGWNDWEYSYIRKVAAYYDQNYWKFNSFENFDSDHNVDFTNLGVDRRGIGDLITQYSAEAESRYNPVAARNILFIYIGANDLGNGADASAWYTNLLTYIGTAKATGYEIVVATPIYGDAHDAIPAGQTAVRDGADDNNYIVCDFGAISEFQSGDPDGVYVEGAGSLLHPNDAGHQLLADALIDTIETNSLLDPPDITAPVLSTATVENANKNKIVLTYGENLDAGSVPANGDFAISGGKTVTGVSISGAIVTLSVNSNYAFGDVITASYTPGSNPLRDAAHNNCVALVNRSVTNNIANPDVTAPVIAISTVENINKNKILLTYSEALDATSVPANGDFSVPGKTVTGVAINGAIVSVTVSVDFAFGDAPTISYTAGVNKIRDAAHNNAANLVARAVVNNIAAPGAGLAFSADLTIHVRPGIIAGNKLILTAGVMNSIGDEQILVYQVDKTTGDGDFLAFDISDYVPPTNVSNKFDEWIARKQDGRYIGYGILATKINRAV